MTKQKKIHTLFFKKTKLLVPILFVICFLERIINIRDFLKEIKNK